MTRPSRLVTVTYGGLTIGEGTPYDLHDVHQIRESYTEFEFEATVVFNAADSTAAQVLDAALRAAFTKPDQDDFDLKVGGVSWFTLSNAGNTWLSPKAELDSIERFRTERSKAYLLRITAGLPADLSGRAGRRDSRWTLGVTPSGQSTLQIEAIYTALPGVGAGLFVAQADFLPTYAVALQTIVGGIWVETQAATFDPDDQNQVVVARASFQQRLINDSAVGASDPNIEVRSYRVAVVRPESRVLAGSGARPLTRVIVTFDVDVLTTASKKTVWESSVLPYLSTLITTESDVTGSPRVAAENVDFDAWGSRLQGTVTYLVAETPLLAASKRIRGRETTGTTLVPKLDRAKRFRKARFDGPQFRTRTVTLVTLEVSGGNQHKTLFDASIVEATKEGYFLIDSESVFEDLEIPTGRGNALHLIERGSTLTFEFGELDDGGGASTGTGRRVITQPGIKAAEAA